MSRRGISSMSTTSSRACCGALRRGRGRRGLQPRHRRRNFDPRARDAHQHPGERRLASSSCRHATGTVPGTAMGAPKRPSASSGSKPRHRFQRAWPEPWPGTQRTLPHRSLYRATPDTARGSLLNRPALKVLTIVGARPQAHQSGPGVTRSALRTRRTRSPRPYRAALRRKHVRRVLQRARYPAAGPSPRDRLRLPRPPNRTDARGPQTRSSRRMPVPVAGLTLTSYTWPPGEYAE